MYSVCVHLLRSSWNEENYLKFLWNESTRFVKRTCKRIKLTLVLPILNNFGYEIVK